ncbi:unnamed protein product [Rotaria magnacalcarata]|uniref:Ubiquitin-like domain-containing protein n=1 Tax=Rotaria magnacalcarata TaxID=392030 RepID=A0A8S3FFX2_9BILA|nr:unnamed protein product [Rotaria magnacalcarata]
MRISIDTTCTGKERPFDFDVESSTTIKQLKELLFEKVNNITTITAEDLQTSYFDFEGDKLDTDENTLKIYGVEEKSRLKYVESMNRPSRDPDSLGGVGAKFVDVSNEKGLQRIEWAKNAPEWRRVDRGFVLEGICTSPKCKATGQTVAISMHYRNYDITSEPDLLKSICPMCKEYVDPKTCGFNNCWWRIDGTKKEYGKPPKSIKSEWRYADNAYHYFDEKLSGTTSWLRLTFECVKNKPLL